MTAKTKKWAAFEVGLVVARQNGKDAVLEARELAGIFVIGEQLIIHSAHLVDTSLEHQHRLLDLIEESDLQKEIKTVRRANGQEAIEFKNGGRIRFRTRTKGGGRGFSADLVVLNEAMMIPLFSHASLLPTLSARPNPQIWYVGSAVDRLVHDDGHVLASVRQRGIEKQKGLAYFEWSLEGDNPDMLDEKLVSSPKQWLKANPALGIRITPEHVALEQASLDDRAFAVERLGIGDWPPVGKLETVIPLERWDELHRQRVAPARPGRVRLRHLAGTQLLHDRGRGLARGRAGSRRGGRAQARHQLDGRPPGQAERIPPCARLRGRREGTGRLDRARARGERPDRGQGQRLGVGAGLRALLRCGRGRIAAASGHDRAAGGDPGGGQASAGRLLGLVAQGLGC